MTKGPTLVPALQREPPPSRWTRAALLVRRFLRFSLLTCLVAALALAEALLAGLQPSAWFAGLPVLTTAQMASYGGLMGVIALGGVLFVLVTWGAE